MKFSARNSEHFYLPNVPCPFVVFVLRFASYQSFQVVGSRSEKIHICGLLPIWEERWPITMVRCVQWLWLKHFYFIVMWRLGGGVSKATCAAAFVYFYFDPPVIDRWNLIKRTLYQWHGPHLFLRSTFYLVGPEKWAHIYPMPCTHDEVVLIPWTHVFM